MKNYFFNKQKQKTFLRPKARLYNDYILGCLMCASIGIGLYHYNKRLNPPDTPV